MRRQVGTLVLAALATAALGADGMPVLSISGQTWRVAFDSNGFSVLNEEARPDGSAKKVVFAHTDKRINLTVVMKPNGDNASPAEIRDERWRQLESTGLREENPKLSEVADRAFLDYFIETGVPGVAHQKHAHTFVVQGGTRIEVHVSINQFAERDGPWLEKFQQSIKIVGSKA